MFKFMIKTTRSLFTLIAGVIIAVLSAVAAAVLLSKPTDSVIDPTADVLMSFSILYVLTYSMGIFMPGGPVPADKKTEEHAKKLRSQFNGAFNNYDMLCVVPCRRISYAKYFIIIYCLIYAVCMAVMAKLSFMESGYMPQLSLCITVCYSLALFICGPNFFTPSVSFVTIAASVLFCLDYIYLMIVIISDEEALYLLPVLPSGVRLGIAAVCFAVNMYLTISRNLIGDYARDGERVRK